MVQKSFLVILALLTLGITESAFSAPDFQCYAIVKDVAVLGNSVMVDQYRVSGNKSLVLQVALESQRSGKPVSIHLDSNNQLDGISIDKNCTGILH